MSAMTDETFPTDSSNDEQTAINNFGATVEPEQPQAQAPVAETVEPTQPEQNDVLLDFNQWSDSVWKSQDDADTLEPIERYRKYGEYANVQLAKQGRYTPEVEASINQRLFQKSIQDGVTPAEVDEQGNIKDVDTLYSQFNSAPKSAFTNPNVETDAIRMATISSQDPLEQEINKAAIEVSFLQSDQAAKMFAPEDREQKLKVAEEKLRSIAPEDKIADLRDAGLNRALKNGEIPFAAFPTKEGMRVEVSPELLDLADNPKAIAEMFERDPRLDKRMLGAVIQQLSTPKGYEAPLTRINRQQDFTQALVASLNDKEVFNPAAQKTVNEKLQRMVDAYNSNPASAEAVFTDDYIQRNIATNIPSELRQQFDKEEQVTFVRDMVRRMAAPGHDPNDPIKGAVKLSTGEWHLPTALLLDKKSFDKVTSDDSPIPVEQRERLKQTRDQALNVQAPALMSVFANQPVGQGKESFLEFTERKEAEGKSNVEIIDEWRNDPENYKVANDYLVGTTKSVGTGIASLALAPLALGGVEWARDTMVNFDKEEQARKSYAAAFGNNLGMKYDMATMVAPVVVDIAITRGVGAAAKAGLKTALKTAVGQSAKSLTRSIALDALQSGTRTAMKDFIEGRLTSAAAKELVQSGTSKSAANLAVKTSLGAEDVLRLAADDFARTGEKAVANASIGATSYLRSAGSTYVALHEQLKNETNKDGSRKYSDSQVREIALTHANYAGALTATLTLGLNALGLEGVEKFAFNNITTKQAKAVLKNLGQDLNQLAPNLAGQAQVKAAFAQLAKEAIGKGFAMRTAGAGGQEFIEEALDQFGQAINQSIATGQDINLVEAIKEAGYAGLLGAAMGSGASASVDAYRAATSPGTLDVYQEMGQRRTFLNTMAEKMNSSNMPETAKVLRRMAMTDIKPGMDIPAPVSQTTNGQQTTTQEDIPQTDATAGAIPTPSDATMAPEGQGGADTAAPGVTATTTFSDTVVVMAGDENLQMEFDAIMDYDTPDSITIDVEGQEVPSRAQQPLLGNTDVQQTQSSVQTSESSNMDVSSDQSAANQSQISSRLAESPAPQVEAFNEDALRMARSLITGTFKPGIQGIKAEFREEQQNIIDIFNKEATESEKELVRMSQQNNWEIIGEVLNRAASKNKPSQSPAPQAGVPTESLPTDTQPTSRDGGSAAEFDELQTLMLRKGQAANKVQGVKFNKKDEKRLSELTLKYRDRLVEAVDPANDKVVGQDINGTPIKQSQKGTFYTVENGRIRTGPAFAENVSGDGGSAAVQAELPGTEQPRQRSLSSMRAEVLRRIEEVQSKPQAEGNTARLTQLLGKIEERMMEDVQTRAELAKTVRAETKSKYGKNGVKPSTLPSQKATVVATADEAVEPAAELPVGTKVMFTSTVPGTQTPVEGVIAEYKNGKPVVQMGKTRYPNATIVSSEAPAAVETEEETAPAEPLPTVEEILEPDPQTPAETDAYIVEQIRTSRNPEMAMREDPKALAAAIRWLNRDGVIVDETAQANVVAILLPRAAADPNAGSDPKGVLKELKSFGFKAGTDHTEFLKKVAEKGKTPQHRAAAKLLLEFPELVSNVPIVTTSIPGGAAGANILSGTGVSRIMINTAANGRRGAVDTVLHELLHAATQFSVKNPTDAQQRLLTKLERHRLEIRRRARAAGIYDRNMEYALSNTDEFITHWFTDPEFQNIVDNMTKEGEKSLVQTVLDTLRQLLNGKSKSSKNDISEEVMQDMVQFTREAAVVATETHTSRRTELLDMQQKGTTDPLAQSRAVATEVVEAMDEKGANRIKKADLRRALKKAKTIQEYADIVVAAGGEGSVSFNLANDIPEDRLPTTQQFDDNIRQRLTGRWAPEQRAAEIERFVGEFVERNNGAFEQLGWVIDTDPNQLFPKDNLGGRSGGISKVVGEPSPYTSEDGRTDNTGNRTTVSGRPGSIRPDSVPLLRIDEEQSRYERVASPSLGKRDSTSQTPSVGIRDGKLTIFFPTNSFDLSGNEFDTKRNVAKALEEEIIHAAHATTFIQRNGLKMDEAGYSAFIRHNIATFSDAIKEATKGNTKTLDTLVAGIETYSFGNLTAQDLVKAKDKGDFGMLFQNVGETIRMMAQLRRSGAITEQTAVQLVDDKDTTAFLNERITAIREAATNLNLISDQARQDLRDIETLTTTADVRFQPADDADFARHAELEDRFNAGTITPDETTEAERIVERVAKAFINSWSEFDYEGSIPNMGSIESSLDSPEYMGVRMVPSKHFGGGLKSRYDKRGYDRVKQLMESIDEEGVRTPLIVVIDGSPDGVAYVLEGSHRIDAIKELNIPEFPALVLYDTDTEPFTGVPLDQRFNAESPDIRFNPADDQQPIDTFNESVKYITTGNWPESTQAREVELRESARKWIARFAPRYKLISPRDNPTYAAGEVDIDIELGAARMLDDAGNIDISLGDGFYAETADRVDSERVAKRRLASVLREEVLHAAHTETILRAIKGSNKSKSVEFLQKSVETMETVIRQLQDSPARDIVANAFASAEAIYFPTARVRLPQNPDTLVDRMTNEMSPEEKGIIIDETMRMVLSLKRDNRINEMLIRDVAIKGMPFFRPRIAALRNLVNDPSISGEMFEQQYRETMELIDSAPDIAFQPSVDQMTERELDLRNQPLFTQTPTTPDAVRQAITAIDPQFEPTDDWVADMLDTLDDTDPTVAAEHLRMAVNVEGAHRAGVEALNRQNYEREISRTSQIGGADQTQLGTNDGYSDTIQLRATGESGGSTDGREGVLGVYEEQAQTLRDTLIHAGMGYVPTALQAQHMRRDEDGEPTPLRNLQTYLRAALKELQARLEANPEPRTAVQYDRTRAFLADALAEFAPASARVLRYDVGDTLPPSIAASVALQYADDVNDQGFYSKLAEVIQAKIPNKATPQQIMATIDPTRGSGVKSEEIKWTGIEAWMQGKDKVDKAELLQWLRDEGAVRFDEVSIQKPKEREERIDQSSSDIEAELNRRGYFIDEQYGEMEIVDRNGEMVEDEDIDSGSQNLIRQYADALTEEQNLGAEVGNTRPKYAQYQLPGGENYREVVLAMPEKPDTAPSFTEWMESKDYPQSEKVIRVAEYQREFPPRDKAAYTSSHFPDVPNYVAHMRLNERDNGLFIEEIQSDRHQAGRKKGYKEQDVISDEQRKANEAIKKYKDAVAASGMRQAEFDQTPEGRSLSMDAADASYRIRNGFDTTSQDGIADAPFRTTWPLAMFKRALRDAVASGKDWIGWTTGDTQAERYDLSKQVRSITVTKENEKEYHIMIETLNDGEYDQGYHTQEELVGLIGKDLAEKAINDGGGEYSGIDLRVGGKGMKGFYDNMLPKEIGKYVKQWGANVELHQLTVSKNKATAGIGKTYFVVGGVAITDPLADETYGDKLDPTKAVDYWVEQGVEKSVVEKAIKEVTSGYTSIWRVDITPKMRESVSKGQVLFNPAADQDPFENDPTTYLNIYDGSLLTSPNVSDPLAEEMVAEGGRAPFWTSRFWKTLFGRRNNMPQPWSQLQVNKATLEQASESTMRKLSKKYDRIVKAITKDGEFPTDTFSAAIGSTKPLLTSEALAQVEETFQNRMEAAKGLDPERVAAAKEFRDTQTAAAKQTYAEAVRRAKAAGDTDAITEAEKAYRSEMSSVRATYASSIRQAHRGRIEADKKMLEEIAEAKDLRNRAMAEATSKQSIETIDAAYRRTEDAIMARHNAAMNQIDKRRIALEEQALVLRSREIIEAEIAEGDRLRAERDEARAELRNNHPDLYEWVKEYDSFRTGLQKRLQEMYKDNPELHAKIDRSLGLHLVRSYQIHQSTSLAKQVLEGDKFKDVRASAINYFKGQLEPTLTVEMIDSNPDYLDRVEALQDTEAFKAELNKRALQAFEDFVLGHGEINNMIGGSSDLSTEFARLFKQKKDIPQEVRDALVEIKDPFYNSMRTVQSMARIIAIQKEARAILKNGRAQGLLINENEKNNGVRILRITNNTEAGRRFLEDPELSEAREKAITTLSESLRREVEESLRLDQQRAYLNDNQYQKLVDETTRAKAERLLTDLVKGEQRPSMLPKNLQSAFTQVISDLRSNNDIPAEISAEFDMTNDQSRYTNWVKLIPTRAGANAYAPLADWYADPVTARNFQAAHFNAAAAPTNLGQQIMQGASRVAMGIAGSSLAVVTLGNPSYFSRNVFGGTTILISIGVNPFAKGSDMFKLTWAATMKPENIDERVQRLIALGVLRNGAKTGYVRELIQKMNDDPIGLLDKIEELASKADSRLGNTVSKGREVTSKLYETLTNFSEFTETFVAVGAYNHYHTMLTEAGFGTEQQIEEEAARRTKMVIPSRTETSQFIKAFSTSGIGALIAPFLRFKADIWRTTINNYKMALDDMKSDNDVIRRNGKRQIAAAVFTHGVIASGLSYIFQMIRGITDDEDEKIRYGMPDYMQDALLFYLPPSLTKDGNISFINATYMLPHAFVTAPFLNTVKALNRGDMEEVVDVWVRYISEDALGENITASKIMDISRNIDPMTGRPIVTGTDNLGERIYKKTMHVIGGAYNPMVLRRTMQFIDAVNAGDNPAQTDSKLYSPQGILAQMIIPTKVTEYELVDLERRAFQKIARDNRSTGLITGRLQLRGNMTEGQVQDIVTEAVEARRKVFQNFKETSDTFRELTGETKAESAQNAVNAGLSRSRVNQVLGAGVVDKPVLSKEQQQDLLNAGGQKRLDWYLKSISNVPRYIELE